MNKFTRGALVILGVAVPVVSSAGSGLKPGTVFRDCVAVCPEMIVLPSGDLAMGSPEGVGSKQERPVHTVTIAQPFAVSKFEVTFDEVGRLRGRRRPHAPAR
jgi:hypothetical protein